MTLFAPPMAMATTQLARVIHHDKTFSWRMQPKAEHKPLRMSWVVVTDERGQRQLRMRWETASDCSRPAL